jgi:hypothetical protein
MALARAGEAAAELSSPALALNPSPSVALEERGRTALDDVEPVTFMSMSL